MSGNYESMTDAELSEAFAVKVAGWERSDEPCGNKTEIRYRQVGTLFNGLAYYSRLPACFATSADAVLPWLPRGFQANNGATKPSEWCASIYQPKGDMYAFLSFAPTFPRAACIALLRAKEATP